MAPEKGKPKRELVLNKGQEKFIFRYNQGDEGEILDTLIDQAKDQKTDFDWFDAAVLSFRLTQSLIGQIDYLSQGDNKHNYMGDETDTTNQTPNPPESYDNS
jgi:hypothetical protein